MYDLITVQEVRDSDLSAVKKLMNKLNRYRGGGGERSLNHCFGVVCYMADIDKDCLAKQRAAPPRLGSRMT